MTLQWNSDLLYSCFFLLKVFAIQKDSFEMTFFNLKFQLENLNLKITVFMFWKRLGSFMEVICGLIVSFVQKNELKIHLGSSHFRFFRFQVESQVEKIRAPMRGRREWTIENQREFLNDAFKRMRKEKMEDWYDVSKIDLVKLGGGGILQKYGGSPLRLITTVFSEHEWNIFRFRKLPHNFWNQTNKKKFLEWAAIELGFKKQILLQ